MHCQPNESAIRADTTRRQALKRGKRKSKHIPYGESCGCKSQWELVIGHLVLMGLVVCCQTRLTLLEWAESRGCVPKQM